MITPDTIAAAWAAEMQRGAIHDLPRPQQTIMRVMFYTGYLAAFEAFCNKIEQVQDRTLDRTAFVDWMDSVTIEAERYHADLRELAERTLRNDRTP